MCRKDNDGLGFNSRSDILADALQLRIDWVINVIHDVRSTMGKAVMGGQNEKRRQRSKKAQVIGDGERTYKKTGVLAGIIVVVEILAALLSIGKSKGTIDDLSIWSRK